MRRGEIDGRFDSNYWASHRLLAERYANPRYPLARLGDSTLAVQYGSSALANSENRGLRMVRMNNLQGDEWDFSDVKHVPLGLQEARRYRLKRGDLLFNRTNSKELVGKCGVFNEPGVWVSASYLIRVRMDDRKLLPQFTAFFLNSDAGRIQIDRVSRQIAGMTNVNAEELKDLVIPVPPIKKQEAFVVAMEVARASRRAKQAEADALLSSLDDYLLATLGISASLPDTRATFCISQANAKRRLDPHFHRPFFAQVQSALVANGARPLQELARFSHESWEPLNHHAPSFRYIEISGVDTATGEATWNEIATNEAPSRARMAVRHGDIIVSLTRPHHGAIAQITKDLDGCTASTGFAVLRDIAADVDSDYLWCAMRTQLSLQQMLQRASGGNYPAISETELANVLVPIPDMTTQKAIATEVQRRREQARRLRTEAEAQWVKAKRWFEDQLLGPAP